MIHHFSIDAHNPLQVAIALAEILNGKVYQFFVPGSYIALPFDNHGTHIVVFQAGDVWTPGVDDESAQVLQTTPTNWMATHVAISVSATQQQIERIGQREGWRVLHRHENVPFPAIEFWVENRILFEFLLPEFEPQYLQTIQPEWIEPRLGQPIQSNAYHQNL